MLFTLKKSPKTPRPRPHDCSRRTAASRQDELLKHPSACCHGHCVGRASLSQQATSTARCSKSRVEASFFSFTSQGKASRLVLEVSRELLAKTSLPETTVAAMVRDCMPRATSRCGPAMLLEAPSSVSPPNNRTNSSMQRCTSRHLGTDGTGLPESEAPLLSGGQASKALTLTSRGLCASPSDSFSSSSCGLAAVVGPIGCSALGSERSASASSKALPS